MAVEGGAGAITREAKFNWILESCCGYESRKGRMAYSMWTDEQKPRLRDILEIHSRNNKEAQHFKNM